MSWHLFAQDAPALAAGAARLLAEAHGYAFLATTSVDGSPRVHPVAPVITRSAVHLAVHRDSPKLRDLRRDPRFALHSSVRPPADEELALRGTAAEIDDDRLRRTVAQERVSGAELHDAMALLALAPTYACWTEWRHGSPRRVAWRSGPGSGARR